ncbi:unnamed protein product [Symbiodinium sp. CCMP2592]|nr:unnamed protein product [Symbiodinium sp. CCMP2592]
MAEEEKKLQETAAERNRLEDEKRKEEIAAERKRQQEEKRKEAELKEQLARAKAEEEKTKQAELQERIAAERKCEEEEKRKEAQIEGDHGRAKAQGDQTKQVELPQQTKSFRSAAVAEQRPEDGLPETSLPARTEPFNAGHSEPEGTVPQPTALKAGKKKSMLDSVARQSMDKKEKPPTQVSTVPAKANGEQLSAPAEVELPAAKVQQQVAESMEHDSGSGYTRRAAANLLKRLSNNPARLLSLPPALTAAVQDDNQKSALIDALVQSAGSLEAVAAHYHIGSVQEKARKERAKLTPLTAIQLEKMYGSDAPRVMREKEEQSLVQDDPNLTGAKLYLHSLSTREVETNSLDRATAAFVYVEVSALAKSGQARPSIGSGSAPSTPANTVMAKVTETHKMITQLKGDVYAAKCLEELTAFEQKFQNVWDQVSDLMKKKVEDEQLYLPLGREFLVLKQESDRTIKTAASLIKAANLALGPTKEPKAKASRKRYDNAGMDETSCEGKRRVKMYLQTISNLMELACSPKRWAKAMSYSKSQKLAKAFANDGVKKRDLLQMVQLPVFSTTAEREDKQTRVRSIWLVTTPASIVLPSDVLAELSKRGLLSSCLEGFGSVREWWDRENDPVYKGLIDHSEYPYPLLFHEDVMHLVHLGVLRDLLASVMLETLRNGEMSRFLGLQDQSPKPNEILYRFTSRAQAWCKERRLDLGLNPITMDTLNATLKYPELRSTIKASRCRNLLAFVTHFAVELEKQPDPDDCSSETAHWRRARACVLWSLDAALWLGVWLLDAMRRRNWLLQLLREVLNEWRHENRGLAVLLAADSLIRKKVYKLNNDKRKDFPTFSEALCEVLTNHKQLWNDARSTAELEKFRQVEHEFATPKRPRSRSPPPTPPKNEAKARKNRARRQKEKELLKQARAERDRARDQAKPNKPSVPKLTEKDRVDRDTRVPEKEWKKIMSFSYTGARRCPWFNSPVPPPGEFGRLPPAPVLERPPGDFALPPPQRPPAQAANDVSCQKLTAAPSGRPPPWALWADVPRDPDTVRELGPWCLEIFAGSAGLTVCWRRQGLKTSPPVDTCISENVLESIDLLDAQVFDWLLLLCRMGAIAFLHLSVPCSTFSVARDRPGGPPPLRSQALPLGLHVLKKNHQAQLFEANELLFRSLLLFDAVVQAGGDASIENPRDSLIWQVPQVQQLKVRLHLYNVDLDQCEYGSPHRKPTRLLVSHAALLVLARTCSGGHVHEPLRGVLRSVTGKKIFKTKAAQVYPPALCSAWAIAVATVVQHSAQQFAASFALTAPTEERKRTLGSQISWKGHRQSAAARLVAASGYQLKRGAAKPLLDIECEPGQAIQWSLQVLHPFTVQPALPDKIVDNIKFIVSSPQALVARRSERLQFWHQRAVALLPQTDQILRSIADAPLRRLLRGAPDYADVQLGSCTHVALYDELFAAIGCTDHQILQGIRSGFPIVGEIQRSGRWPPFTKPQRSVPVQEALDRAWELRAKVFRRCRSVPVSDNLRSLWKVAAPCAVQQSGPQQQVAAPSAVPQQNLPPASGPQEVTAPCAVPQNLPSARTLLQQPGTPSILDMVQELETQMDQEEPISVNDTPGPPPRLNRSTVSTLASAVARVSQAGSFVNVVWNFRKT